MSEPMRLLGIDPGNTGAAAIVEGDEVLWTAAWRARTRQGERIYEVREMYRERARPSRWVRVPALIGYIIADAASEHVIDAWACEGQYQARGRSTAGTLTLARMAGELAGPTRATTPGSYLQPQEWRRRVGIGATGRADAKRWAVDVVRDRTGMLLSGDEAEAVCLAWAALL